MALKDLYLTVLSDNHRGNKDGFIIANSFHPDIVTAHNLLVEEVLSLRRRVRELEKDAAERDSRESKTD